jgi:hypothetical protein
MIFGAFSALAWFAVFFMAHVLLFFVRPEIKRAKAILVLLALILAGEVLSVATAFHFFPGADFLLRGGLAMGILWGVLTILCLFVLYMPFYYVVDTSLSVESLILIEGRKKGSFSVAQLQERFVSKKLVGDRLETMASNGWLVRSGNGYGLTAKGWFAARVFLFMKNLWNLGAGG